jgi:hypothetical protein
MPHRASLSVTFMVRATRQMIEHFRNGENLSTWYNREVRQPWQTLSELHVTTIEE